ncbi:TIP41 [Candida jiufengensis]|uniref:TIP41 n=1 Tax=Candida jiufengensis TaxID=497108 RepID=UPI0022250C90|nr:TIP41 [Candida jiufengensis]KAI5956275.1 TIP41 [Candida jiufengensis]
MSEDNKKTNEDVKKQTTTTSKFAIPTTQRRGIDAIHVNSARQMVQLHTQGRNPQSQPQPKQKLPTASTPKFASISSSFSQKISIPNHKQDECKNPQCDHCGKIIIPSPQSSFPIQDIPSIKVGDWEIYTIKKPILNSVELDNLADTKFEFPLPEMIFGNNLVKIKNVSSLQDQKEIWFNAIDALDTLDEDVHLKVSYHEEWLKSRQLQQKKKLERGKDFGIDEDIKEKVSDLTEEVGIKPYDWTYSTNYIGKVSGFIFKDCTDSNLEIPIEKLTKPDPILFFDEMILFEDELADNGISMLSIKIRVMPTCLLLLSRFFLRIDNVIFRIRDCRIFIDFDTNEVLREYKLQEYDYDKLLKKSISSGGNNGDPKKNLRDQNWVSLNIPTIKRTIEQCIVE